MECLAIVCLYVSAHVGAHNFDSVVAIKEQQGRVEYSRADMLANVTLGAEWRGAFVEAAHTSDPTTIRDRGWEEVRVGYRMSWGIGKREP